MSRTIVPKVILLCALIVLTMTSGCVTVEQFKRYKTSQEQRFIDLEQRVMGAQDEKYIDIEQKIYETHNQKYEDLKNRIDAIELKIKGLEKRVVEHSIIIRSRTKDN